MDCKICKGRGFITKKDNMGYTVAKDCVCRRQEKWEKSMEKKGLLKRLKTNNFNNYNTDTPERKRAKSVCVAYSKDYKGKSLMITGQVGGGKTHLALATIKEISQNNIQDTGGAYTFVEFVNYTGLLSELKQSERFDAENTTEEIINKYAECSVLVLDDLYKATMTPKERGWVYQIVERRYNESKSTIITTEHTFEELLKIDQSVASRLYEMTDGKYRIGMKEANYRLRR